MKAEVLNPDQSGIARACQILKKSGLVAIPTETVYGLAANALDPKAVSKIFEAKSRPADNPLIVHVPNFSSAEKLVTDIPKEAYILSKEFWPGPLTLIMKKSSLVPEITSGGLDTVAIRMPDNPIALDLIKKSGLYLAAPSANTSGKPSPTKAEHVINDLGAKIDAVIDGGSCKVGLESTVVSLVGDVATLLRPGAVTAEQLEALVGKVQISKAVTEKVSCNSLTPSPGMKYKHYAPNAKIILVKTDDNKKFIDFVNNLETRNQTAIVCYDEEKKIITLPTISLGSANNLEEQAKNLFDILWKIDKSEFSIVYAHYPPKNGVGLAVYNRLIRAAGFEVITIE